MVTFNMRGARTRLSELVARAEAGEEVFVARRNKPAVKLVPVDALAKNPREPERFADLRGSLPSNLLDNLPFEDKLAAWKGRYSGDGH